MPEPVTVLRADTPHGEIALRHRGDVDELIVNGVFAMDSVETASEIELADAAGAARRVLVAGLGLGYTTARLLDRGVEAVDVVELAEPLVEWARAGATPQLGALASDARVRLHHGDIADWIAVHAGPWDAVLLDVDNGPSFLIHDHNARVYRAELLAAFLDRLSPGGALIVWCEQRSPALHAALRGLDAAASELLVPIEREGRSFDYALYRAQAPG